MDLEVRQANGQLFLVFILICTHLGLNSSDKEIKGGGKVGVGWGARMDSLEELI